MRIAIRGWVLSTFNFVQSSCKLALDSRLVSGQMGEFILLLCIWLHVAIYEDEGPGLRGMYRPRIFFFWW